MVPPEAHAGPSLQGCCHLPAQIVQLLDTVWALMLCRLLQVSSIVSYLAAHCLCNNLRL